MLTSFKRLSRDEMDQAAAILRASFDDRLPWLSGLHTPDEDRAFFKGQVFNTCEVWGAFQADRMIGFIAFREDWVEHLYVLPDRQRRGKGGALLQLAKAVSQSLSLWTFQRNMPARRFYESQGFVAIEETDGSRNEEREPDVLYRWTATSPRGRAS